MSDPFVHRVEVHFYEVDQVGVVFNAWYSKTKLNQVDQTYRGHVLGCIDTN